jgi:GTP-binding protein HflX
MTSIEGVFFGMQLIYGNVEGIKRATLWQMQEWVKQYDRTLFVDRELLSDMVKTSLALNRELCVFLARNGRLLAIGVGNATTVPLKDLNQKRGDRRLNGVRCIHTHPNASGHLSDVDISALTSSRYDCMCAIGARDGRMVDMEVAYLTATGVEKVYIRGGSFDDDDLLRRIGVAEEDSRQSAVRSTKTGRSLLVHAGQDQDVEQSLTELAALARTLGYEPVDTLVQRRDKPDRLTYVGSGKVDELRLVCQVKQVDTVICDHQLTGVQIKNLRDILGLNVIDRTGVILDIFAKHATTNEGKMQVELARLQHSLPLVSGQSEGLSRQRGGLHAMAGAGETKAESDRRAIRRQISQLRERLQKLESERDLRRRTRQEGGLKNVVIVGYTNAGKSTLMNYITKAGVLEENKLFATLDAVSRTVWDEGYKYLLTDTVGFIRRLPHEFVEAFKSTLDEARYADLLLHVVDVSSPYMTEEYDVVERVLGEIGAYAPTIVVYNKCDRGVAGELPRLQDTVTVSAKTGEGVLALRRLIKEKLTKDEGV